MVGSEDIPQALERAEFQGLMSCSEGPAAPRDLWQWLFRDFFCLDNKDYSLLLAAPQDFI